MSRVNNTIDKFGRQKFANGKNQRGPPGVGFKLSNDGNFNMEGKCLQNVASPKNANDAATKAYVLEQVHLLRKQLSQILMEYIREHDKDMDLEVKNKKNDGSRNSLQWIDNISKIMASANQ